MAAASKRKVEIKSQQRLCALEPRLLQCVEQYAATAKWRGGAAAQQAFTSRMRQVSLHRLAAWARSRACPVALAPSWLAH